MKLIKKISIVAVVGSVLLVGKAFADSTFGYSSAGTGNVSATAQAKVTVNVPKLILLRVGTAGATIDTLTFSASPTINSLPGATLGTSGSSKAATWDGAVPLFADTAGQDLNALVWTNSAGGGELTCATTADTQFTSAFGLTSANVAVSSSGTLGHPGTSTACGSTVSVAKNTLLGGTWTYSISGSALANAAAGTHTQTTTYTATTL